MRADRFRGMALIRSARSCARFSARNLSYTVGRMVSASVCRRALSSRRELPSRKASKCFQSSAVSQRTCHGASVLRNTPNATDRFASSSFSRASFSALRRADSSLFRFSRASLSSLSFCTRPTNRDERREKSGSLSTRCLAGSGIAGTIGESAEAASSFFSAFSASSSPPHFLSSSFSAASSSWCLSSSMSWRREDRRPPSRQYLCRGVPCFSRVAPGGGVRPFGSSFDRLAFRPPPS
mmetsp:Transcript_20369/g.57367  ORF Transcript_20369/g.57367 Transcript_20369/m.57367 type:complete len:238 (-) Transcript_20369:738-1451(-)